MKKLILLLTLILGILIIFSFWQYQNNELTFEKCYNSGGTLWNANLFNPELFPFCTSCMEDMITLINV